LNAARKREGTKVLANPTIVIEEGRLGSLVAGGQHSYVAGFENGRERREYFDVGTRVQVRPTTVKQGRVRLDLDLGVAELIELKKVVVPANDGTNWTLERPLVDRRSVATTVELKLGETFFLADRHGKGDLTGGTERELYLTVQPLEQ
jgi:Flp pilus assembly secretin CpaC